MYHRPLAIVLASACMTVSTTTVAPCQPAHLWSHGLGGLTEGGDDTGASVAVDESGNTFVTGSFQGTMRLAEDVVVTSAGNDDAFLVSYDASGTLVWSRRFGGEQDDAGRCVVVDGDGNVIVTGTFQGTAAFGGEKLGSAGQTDIFLAKYDGAGNHLWSRRFGGTNSDLGYGVAVDGEGNVLVTGTFQATVDFGGGPLVSVGGSNDIFVAAYDPDGMHVWSRRFGGPSSDGSVAIAGDDAGNVFVTGAFPGSVDFGGGLLTSAGGTDIFVAAYDASGAHLWSRRFGGTTTDVGRDIAVDGDGNVLATGEFIGTADFGGGPLTSAGFRDVYLAKYDPAGTHVWSQRFGDVNNDSGGSLAVDGDGNILVAGDFAGTVDFGGGPLSSAGCQDVFVAAYDGSGSHLFSQRFGGTECDYAHGVATGETGNVVATGTFTGMVDFGGGPLTSTGTDDIFIASWGEISVAVEPGVIAPRLPVLHAHPSPFNRTTNVRYVLPEAGRVRLSVFDVQGRLVDTLVDDAVSAGEHFASWSGTREGGAPVSAGLYFVRLESDRVRRTTKVLLQR